MRLNLRNVFLCIIGLAAAVSVGCHGAAENVETPSSEKSPAPVKIINGAGRREVCGSLAAELGVGLVGGVESYRNGEGRIDYSLNETTILYGEENRAQAEALRAKLGYGVVTPADGLEDIEVVVGWDAVEPQFPSAPKSGVLISKSEKTLYYYESGELTHIWPCAIGKDETPTPTGNFEVTVTLEKPTWYWQGKAIPPGPDNGLGDWFIGINKKGYGIHGTNEPPSIGTAASHGCIRMYNSDAGELAKIVSAGTTVVIAE